MIPLVHRDGQNLNETLHQNPGTGFFHETNGLFSSAHLDVRRSRFRFNPKLGELPSLVCITHITYCTRINTLCMLLLSWLLSIFHGWGWEEGGGESFCALGKKPACISIGMRIGMEDDEGWGSG